MPPVGPRTGLPVPPNPHVRALPPRQRAGVPLRGGRSPVRPAGALDPAVLQAALQQQQDPFANITPLRGGVALLEAVRQQQDQAPAPTASDEGKPSRALQQLTPEQFAIVQQRVADAFDAANPVVPDAWVQLCGLEAVHWVHPRPAAFWIDEAVRLTDQAALDRLTAGTPAEQEAGVRAAWTALGNAYQALDLRPPADPAYGEVMRAWYGRRLSARVEDALAQRIGAGGYSAYYTDPATGHKGAVYDRIVAEWAALGKRPISTEFPLCSIIVRAELDDAGNPLFNCVQGGLSGPGDCDFAPRLGAYHGCARWGSGREGCDPLSGLSVYDWTVWAWDDGPRLGGDPCNVHRVLPPLAFSFEVAADLARRLAARSLREIVADAVLNERARNTRTLARLLSDGKIPRGTGDQAAAWRQFEAAAAALPNDAAVANHEARVKMAAWSAGAIGAVAGAVLPIPVVGPIMAGLMAGGAAIASLIIAAIPGILPTFINVEELDEFGRQYPVFEHRRISGRDDTVRDDGTGEKRPPTHAVAAPTGPTAERPLLGLDEGWALCPADAVALELPPGVSREGLDTGRGTPPPLCLTPPASFPSALDRAAWIARNPGCPVPAGPIVPPLPPQQRPKSIQQSVAALSPRARVAIAAGLAVGVVAAGTALAVALAAKPPAR